MCGILFSNNPKVNKSTFSAALNLMRHRGPDAPPGIWQNDHVRMGHNRLKIQDIDDRSNQPFWSKDGRYAIIFNGEIYNFNELAQKYKITQSTTSDTEVLVELFALLGHKMLHQLNGMFAMIIYDNLSNDVFIARDRLGIKPLYYTTQNGFDTFASEISSILELIDNHKIDPIGLRQYTKLRTFFRSHTIYEAVKMFPPGHYQLGGKLIRYWELPIGEQEAPDDDELMALLSDAVNCRLISDVPVGSYLSGGLDSTIIAGLAKKPHTWTVGFKNCNEFKWAKIASNEFASQHTEVLITEDEFISLLKKMIQKRREPFSVPNEILLYKMTKAVKKKNTVVLSGEGADELFFGYDRIFRWANSSKWDLEKFSQFYSYGSNSDLEIVEYVLEPFLHLKNPIDIVAHFFQLSHLHGLLRRLDNATMLCSVEARVPFVDHRLVERMAGVPFNYRINNGIVKHPLKTICSHIVPAEIINRKKIGFPVPLENIPFPVNNKNDTPMDKWLNFNLQELEKSSINP